MQLPYAVALLNGRMSVVGMSTGSNEAWSTIRIPNAGSVFPEHGSGTR